MDFLRRLARRLRAVLNTARGFETGEVSPLPQPLVDPRVPTAQLVSEADARGVADAKAAMLDSWSFGGPDAANSEVFDPSYVLALRHACEAAVATIRDQQAITESRIVHVRRWRDDAEDMMASARSAMRSVAAREAAIEARAVQRSQARAGVPHDPAGATPPAPDDRLWEGETNTLGLFWRILVLLGLVAAELPVQYYVFRYFLGDTGGAGDLVLPLTLSTSIFMVLGPHVAALLLRTRQATGGERRIWLAAAALATPWLFVAVLLGLLRGVILDTDPARAERLHLTPATIVVMFVALMLIVGVMSFMLGLARRHPFQEAYVRHRHRRDQMDTLRRSMAERINPAYRESPDQVAADERAVRESYAAAEEAYFAALARTVGDPSFTEAVQQRRGRRPLADAPA